ncbi:unconventional myosin-XVIIIa isoform X3 [Dendroctonus ponderosae]|uniref:unconventional myosin-XVIIIa isoform X3 n=1 Tax=Dendroctonus ponderosae TaxID=77166 RepID=UPI0020355E38|nr:unconventional myosin-XVIIIa isoform X3 [Dendroctonus ponderosae]XP_019760221.2 unconventional myosin-XVIIIa isoform X3 [Dendroctonus ponderosae]XP_019760222.2 unconventional myosin-XVIIIa isoform X3 [Dendroctonus ponderosae]XP_048521560.1 unconventional myosin-XVIIIa isoform X3 [Dendroctonus ponderosae]
MSSTQKPKYMGTPFIKKIYETHKKWLGGESKSQKQEKTEYARRNSSIEPQKVQPNYENASNCEVEEKRSIAGSDLDSLQSDKLRIVINTFDKILDEYSSISSDVAKDKSFIIHGPYVNNIEVDPSKFISAISPPVPKRHLSQRQPPDHPALPTKVAIKIVPPPRKHAVSKTLINDEKKVTEQEVLAVIPKASVAPAMVTSKSSTKIPKLVKAKTCSIIESKCILKKTNSTNGLGQLSFSQPSTSNKTKSMTNLDVNASICPKIVPISIDVSKAVNEKPQESIQSRAEPAPKIPPKPARSLMQLDIIKDTLPSRAKPPIESPVKVKDLVKRLNSLTDSPTADAPLQVPTLSKAVSTTNLSLSKKHGSVSKIPVNSNLRKSFPSTPCHLDKLDNNGCVSVGRKSSTSLNKARSVQNLAKPKLSLSMSISSTTDEEKKAVTKAKSVQNLAKPKLSLAKPVEKGLGKSVPDLVKNKPYSSKPKVFTGSSESVNRVKVSKNIAKMPEVKAKVSSGITVIKAGTSSFPNAAKSTSKAARDVAKFKPNVKSTQNAMLLARSKTKAMDLVDGSSVPSKNPIKRTETLSSKSRPSDVTRQVSAIKGTKDLRDKNVSSAVKKIENRDEVHTGVKVVRNQTFKKSDLPAGFNEVKRAAKASVQHRAQYEPKLVEKSTKIADKSSLRKSSPSRVKLDLERTKNFLDMVVTKDESKFYLDPGDYIKSSATKEGANISDGKNLDYNSDDSGNISTEVDCDELNSTVSSVRSRTSTESLPTVLDASGASVPKNLSAPCAISIVLEDVPKKIFFRTGVVSQLEAQRDERLAGVVISLQAHCRGYLARRKLQQKKLQDLAVRCIQRNVRKFMLVRDWPWWRLLIRVTPLLNVHRTEEELRAKTAELEALKTKLHKIDTERTSLKNDNDLLEAKLSEMTADLAEEHSTATLAAERLDAETSERMRLEKELSETKHKNKELQQSSERLEMELLYAKSDLNGICEEDEDGSEGDGVYKQRYERALKELEFTKRRLQQQHEDDLEQLVGLKKQLEKKLADAYEEVEEQRQVVGTWKRKVQKLNGEMNDLKLLLEEQSSRNNLLEKKQRKYDSEAAMLHDELKKEKHAKDRLCREKEVLMAEKFAMESTIADVRLELELKEERLSALQREFDEITCGGKTEEEVTTLRKQKIDCERRLQDQEEELDELAGQVQLLEQAKLRLEMTLESMRKEAKKESQMREEELEDARCNAQKKVKALEQQLENEHEERTTLLREKHELERRLQAAADSDRQDRAGDEALLQRLKRDLKRTKALLRDTQAQLERQKAETPGKNMIRQLRNQLEDLECARAIAAKTKQSLEHELSEMQGLLEDAHKQKSDAEDRANGLLREKSDIQTQLEENEEELAEVLKKYKAAVQQMSVDQMALQEQVSIVSELEVERNHLKEQLAELSTRLESAESMGGASSNLLYKRSELKVKELESKLELEQTTRSRLEVQIARLKETVEKLQTDITASRVKEQQAQDQVRKLQRHVREIKEELNKSLAKESEVIIKKKELEKRCETLEAESSTARADLRLALKRIEDLQSAIQGELEDSISNESDSDEDSYGSDESVNTFLANHKVGSPVKSEKSIANDVRRLSSTSRSSTSSNLGKDSSYA